MLAPISNIVCGDRIRSANPATVSALAASITEVGLLNPLTVSVLPVVRNGRTQDGYMLIGGLHRLEAVKSLGWNEVEVTVSALTGPSAVIAECDENLCGTNLTAAERALFTARRKAAYEALHPETKHGSPTVSRQVGDTRERSDVSRFTLDTARKTGQSERSVQRDAGRGERVAPEVLSQIKGTKLDTGKMLDELASLPREQQPARVAEITERKAVKPAPAPLNDIETEEQWMTSMMRVWNRGAPTWRERFLETVDRPVFDGATPLRKSKQFGAPALS